MNLDINVLINLACVIASVCFFIAKLDAMTKANREFYETTIASLHENISQKFSYLEGTIQEKFKVVDERFKNITEDVKRLEQKQLESNRIKERLAIIEHTVKMLMNGKGLGEVLESFNTVKSEP